MSEREVKAKLESYISDFVLDLMKGKHIEIHMAKNNDLKIYIVDKKKLK